MKSKIILLVEDNPDDVQLTLRALKKSKIMNEVVVAQDGVEALDYLFGTGKYAGRDTTMMPQVILLDLKMPKMDGLEALQRIRKDERTKLLPVVVLTTSSEDRDRVESYKLGEQLCSKAGGFQSVCRGSEPARAVLVGFE